MGHTVKKLGEALAEGKHTYAQLVSMLELYWSLVDQQVDVSKNKKKIQLIQNKIDSMAPPSIVVNCGTTEEPEEEEIPFDVVLASKFLQLRRSALKRNKDFNLTLSDVKVLLTRKTCYYTGTRFEEEGPLKRSIDRVDSTQGYVKGNVVACAVWANNLKNAIFEDPSHELYGKADEVLKLIGKCK